MQHIVWCVLAAEVSSALQQRAERRREKPAASRHDEPLRQHEERCRRRQELQVLCTDQLGGHLRSNGTVTSRTTCICSSSSSSSSSISIVVCML